MQTDAEKTAREAVRDFVTKVIVHYTNKAYGGGKQGRTLDLKVEYEVSTNLTAMLLKWKSSKFIQLGADVQPKVIRMGVCEVNYTELERKMNTEWVHVAATGQMTGKQASYFVKYVSFFGIFGERVKEMHLGVDRVKRYGNINRTADRSSMGITIF